MRLKCELNVNNMETQDSPFSVGLPLFMLSWQCNVKEELMCAFVYACMYPLSWTVQQIKEDIFNALNFCKC